MKTCTKCKAKKEIKEFYICRCNKDWRAFWCIECTKSHNKEWYQRKKKEKEEAQRKQSPHYTPRKKRTKEWDEIRKIKAEGKTRVQETKIAYLEMQVSQIKDLYEKAKQASRATVTNNISNQKILTYMEDIHFMLIEKKKIDDIISRLSNVESQINGLWLEAKNNRQYLSDLQPKGKRWHKFIPYKI